MFNDFRAKLLGYAKELTGKQVEQIEDAVLNNVMMKTKETEVNWPQSSGVFRVVNIMSRLMFFSAEEHAVTQDLTQWWCQNNMGKISWKYNQELNIVWLR